MGCSIRGAGLITCAIGRDILGSSPSMRWGPVACAGGRLGGGGGGGMEVTARSAGWISTACSRGVDARPRRTGGGAELALRGGAGTGIGGLGAPLAMRVGTAVA